MKKLTFDFLSIELTRRCNIACRHCMKGNAENIDIGNTTIDSLLNQTQIIGKLQFGGGEPTLCLDKMKYILDNMKKKNVLLFSLEITTNGYNKTKEFVEIVKEYGQYIKYCWDNEKLNLKYHVFIQVSVDKFHDEQGYNSEDGYWFYKVNLYQYATVGRQETGKFPKKKGRAKSLNLKDTWEADYDSFPTMKRVEILSKDLKPCCPNYRLYKLAYEDQVYIVCDMFVSAKGGLTFVEFNNGDFALEDNHIICNVNEEIYENILKYNKNKPTCIQCMRRDEANEALETQAVCNANMSALLNGNLSINDIMEFQARSMVIKDDIDPILKSNYKNQNVNLDKVENDYMKHNYRRDT